MAQDQTHPLFDKHINTLRQSVAACEARISWSFHPESPAKRGDAGLAAGREAFEAYRDASFYLDQPGVIGRVGAEQSPYGLPLNISYPQCSADALIVAAKNATSAWVDCGPDVRTGVCLEILDRLHKHGIEIAYAVMHTSGQPFSLAYQHSLAGALDRGLEAVSAAYREMKQVPGRTQWEKPQSKGNPLKIEKLYTIAPRGIALSVCSATEPTSLSWPGFFASLVTGNPVIINPHPSAVLPMAMTVAVARMVIKEAGFDPNLVSLLVDEMGNSSAAMVGLRPEIRIIDCSCDAQTSRWLEENAHETALFTLKSACNCVVVDSTADYKGMLRNLTFSICLNSGQLLATPRLIMISREGVRTPDGTVSPDQFGRDLSFAIGKLLEDPARGAELLGAIQSPDVLTSLEAIRDAASNEDSGTLLRDTARIEHPLWPAALMATPLLVRQQLTDSNEFLNQGLGPLMFVVETATTAEAISSAERIMREKGALNFSVYTDSQPLQQLAQGVAIRVGVTLNINLCGNLLPLHAEAFSDFYASGENPAASCSFIDAAFVARRFFVVQTRRQLA